MRWPQPSHWGRPFSLAILIWTSCMWRQATSTRDHSQTTTSHGAALTHFDFCLKLWMARSFFTKRRTFCVSTPQLSLELRRFQSGSIRNSHDSSNYERILKSDRRAARADWVACDQRHPPWIFQLVRFPLLDSRYFAQIAVFVSNHSK